MKLTCKVVGDLEEQTENIDEPMIPNEHIISKFSKSLTQLWGWGQYASIFNMEFKEKK